MANTYSQIYLHIVFAVKFRKRQIHKDWKEQLYKYICGTVNNKDEKIFAINGVSDHIHILISIKPNTHVSDLVRDIKVNSTKWINGHKLVSGNFAWQEGFGVFSVSRSQITKVIGYIDKQEAHHQKVSFRREYIAFLKKHEVEFDEKYLFEWFED